MAPSTSLLIFNSNLRMSGWGNFFFATFWQTPVVYQECDLFILGIRIVRCEMQPSIAVVPVNRGVGGFKEEACWDERTSERHQGSLREGNGGAGAVKLRQSYLVHGGGVEGYTGPFSHLMNLVIHWSKCASAQFSCPCFWGSRTSVWAARRLHWCPEKHRLKEEWAGVIASVPQTHGSPMIVKQSTLHVCPKANSLA